MSIESGATRPLPQAVKQAVVVIHGTGSQRPMDTIKKFVKAVWETDKILTANGLPNSSQTWSKPDCPCRRGDRMKLRRLVQKWSIQPRWPLLALGAILLCAIEPAFAQPTVRRGLIFVRVHCSQCHAIDKVGESPLAIAPPFRTLRLRYPVADLQRPLLEGIHPVMPRFQLTPGQVLDMMAYLQTLNP
jgi:cytochrome c